MIEFRQVSKRHGGQVVLDGVDFRLLAGERIGVVGPNGAGKSTIFELIAGEAEADAGLVERAKDIRIGYLRQQVPAGGEAVPIQGYVETAAPDLEPSGRRFTGSSRAWDRGMPGRRAGCCGGWGSCRRSSRCRGATICMPGPRRR
jgi:ATPase subunit of ABC transporter with duplicated ATPase domains